mmetsp:Transcript_21633/g.50896  ORF Transcript_21633/g.50896 Transcript_21633/m.50896 type:complete len:236 (+) Transcript_21633:200-907(+)
MGQIAMFASSVAFLQSKPSNSYSFLFRAFVSLSSNRLVYMSVRCSKVYAARGGMGRTRTFSLNETPFFDALSRRDESSADDVVSSSSPLSLMTSSPSDAVDTESEVDSLTMSGGRSWLNGGSGGTTSETGGRMGGEPLLGTLQTPGKSEKKPPLGTLSDGDVPRVSASVPSSSRSCISASAVVSTCDSAKLRPALSQPLTCPPSNSGIPADGRGKSCCSDDNGAPRSTSMVYKIT